MSNSFKLALAWLFIGSIGYALILQQTTFVDDRGQYVFYDTDSFYHATRILRSVPHGEFYEFDSRSQAWISWPWGYDWFLAQGIRLLLWLNSGINPVALLAYLPPAFIFVNSLLLLGIGRSLGLTVFYCILTLLCFNLLPLTHDLHLVGRIDHHFMEQTWILASLYAGIQFFKYPVRHEYAALFGFILGFSLAIHTELFLLQLPALLTILYIWTLKKQLPMTISSLATSLIVTTILIAIPSEKFRQGDFSFYFLSWFHVYISCCTALLILLAYRSPYTLYNLGKLGALSFVLTLPLINNISWGLSFISASFENFAAISETTSPLKNILASTSSYSALLLLIPASYAFTIQWLKNNFHAQNIYFLIFITLGLLLLLQQGRFSYYGSFALFLPLFLTLEHIAKIHATHIKSIKIGTTLLLFLCYFPSYRNFPATRQLGGSFDFQITQPIYPIIKESCAAAPGLMLADWNDGHFITYFSDCSVTANTMILSPVDFQHVAENIRLMGLTATELLQQQRYPIKYVYVRRNDNIFQHSTRQQLQASNKGLRYELLFSTSLPKQYRLIASLSAPDNSPIAKLYKLAL